MSGENTKSESLEKTAMEKWLGLGALTLLGVLCVMVLKPFAAALMWGVILSFLLFPVQKKLLKWFKGRKTLAAIAVTALAVLVVMGPVTLIGLSLVDDSKKLALTAKEQVMDAPEEAPEWLTGIPFIGDELEGYWGEFISGRRQWTGEKPDTKVLIDEGKGDEDVPGADVVKPFAEQGLSAIKQVLVWSGTMLGKGLAQLTMSLFLIFFMLRDADRLGDRLKVAVEKIAGDRGKRLLKVAGQSVKGVVFGYIGTCVVQAVIAGIGFAIAGVPGAVLLGALTFFVALIPVGPPVIWGGAAIWLFMQGELGWAVFMLVWGFFGISSIDNVLRPYLISQGNKMPFALMFVGLIGGAVAFGLVGIFLGPTLLAVAFRLTDEWTSDGKTALDSK